MALTPGTRLGRYEIVSHLGEGGMGDVYRARDLTLQRDVAVKVLLDEFAADPERLKRFEREARATAALNHPNILAMHDVGTQDGVTFVVSELLEGRTLRDVLAAGPLPPRKAVKFGAQIADGLAAAHAKGVVHRDLKPANLFITSDDRVKILDFGLARILHDSPLDEGTNATTSASLTSPGTVLGSAGYMAPEQVRGVSADHRADIFSLGVVLYEMLSGRRAFHRDTVAGTLAAIVETDPPSWSGDGSAAFQRLVRLVRQCMEKAPNDRFQSARDLSLALADETSDAQPMEPVAPRRGVPPWIVVAATGVVCAAIGAWGWSRFGADPGPSAVRTPVALEISVPDGTVWDGGLHPAISNDGTRIAFVAVRDQKNLLFVRRLSEVTARELPGTTGALQPFFSPDGRRIAFFADQQLKAVEIDGGVPYVICPAAAPRGAAWGDDNAIVFAAGLNTGLSRVPAGGGNPEPLTTLLAGETGHRFPHVLPGATGVLFAVQLETGGYSIAVFDSRSRRHTVVVERGQAPQFGQGRLFFVNDHAEWTAVPFDPAALKPTGPAEPQTERGTGGAFLGDSGLSVARDGSVVFLPFENTLRSLAIVSREGRVEPVPGPPRDFRALRISPDGTKIAANIGGADGSWGDIWIGDVTGGFVPFTRDGLSRSPVWSPNGDRIAFESRRNGLIGAFAQPVLADAPAVQLTEAVGGSYPVSWALDGQTLLLGTVNVRAGMENIVTVRIGDRKVTPVRVPVTGTAYGRLSPDGRWLAYTTRESGQWEVYVTSFPAPGRVWPVSQAGSGLEVVWAHQGDELYFRRADGRLVSVAIGRDGPLGAAPRAIGLGGVTFPLSGGAGIPRYDVFPDGRFLILRTESDRQRVRPLVVVVR